MQYRFVSEFIGDDSNKKVAGEILLRKNQRLAQIANNAKLSIEECKKSMMVLLQHNCITYQENSSEATSQKFITYEGNTSSILQRIRFPSFISIVKDKLGNDVIQYLFPSYHQGEFLIEEFLANGRLTLAMAVKQAADVSAKLVGSLASVGSIFLVSILNRKTKKRRD